MVLGLSLGSEFRDHACGGLGDHMKCLGWPSNN